MYTRLNYNDFEKTKSQKAFPTNLRRYLNINTRMETEKRKLRKQVKYSQKSS